MIDIMCKYLFLSVSVHGALCPGDAIMATC